MNLGTYFCRYEIKDLETGRGRVLINIHGKLIPISFSIDYLKRQGLNPGDEFQLEVPEGVESLIDERILTEKFIGGEMSPEDLRKLEELIGRGASREEILKEW